MERALLKPSKTLSNGDLTMNHMESKETSGRIVVIESVSLKQYGNEKQKPRYQISFQEQVGQKNRRCFEQTSSQYAKCKEQQKQWRRTCGVLHSLLHMWKMQGTAETVGQQKLMTTEKGVFLHCAFLCFVQLIEYLPGLLCSMCLLRHSFVELISSLGGHRPNTSIKLEKEFCN